MLLNLWATWCVPCRKEMPALDALQQRLGGPDFEVVAVNIDTRDPDKPKAFLKELGIRKLAYYADPTAKTFQDLKAIGRAFGMPTTLLVDPQGCEIGTIAGPAEWASDDAVKLIQAALGASATLSSARRRRRRWQGSQILLGGVETCTTEPLHRRSCAACCRDGHLHLAHLGADHGGASDVGSIAALHRASQRINADLTPACSPILNHMVYYSSAPLDRTFAALADPTRRALLARLSETDSLSVSELAEPFAMSLPAVMKHLDVLSDAGLVTRNKSGRTVSCRLRAEPMHEANEWLNRYQRFWTERLDQLAAFLEEELMSTATAVKPSLTIKRRFNAPPAKVFAAWTDPEKVKRWMGPGDGRSAERGKRPARRRPLSLA